MAVKNIKTKSSNKAKATINNKTKTIKKKKSSRKLGKKKEVNTRLLYMVTFFTGVLLIISTYAWFSQTLNVKVKFFDMKVSTDNGLFISLNGIDFSDSVEISLDNVITNLKSTYPNHTNQWATGGLWPVSTNGIKDSNSDKFSVYQGEVSYFKYKKTNRRFLDTKLINEDVSSAVNAYIAFDLFLKNVSGSPKSDNLYLKDTSVDFDDNTPDDIKSSMSGIMDSMRFGFLKIGSVSTKSDVYTIQNQKCNSNCQAVIYEPNSTLHSSESIDKAKDYGVTLADGVATPTYAVTNEGDFLEHMSGQEGPGVPLDTAHFALQNTITNFDNPIFKIPDGIMKLRVYVWIEGQDIDSLETSDSKGAAIYISMNFIKDLAGYQ